METNMSKQVNKVEKMAQVEGRGYTGSTWMVTRCKGGEAKAHGAPTSYGRRLARRAVRRASKAICRNAA
jgi:hypothetical protein